MLVLLPLLVDVVLEVGDLLVGQLPVLVLLCAECEKLLELLLELLVLL